MERAVRRNEERCKLAKSANRNIFNTTQEIMAAFEEYDGKVGPLGSHSRDCCLGGEEILKIT